MSSKEKTFILRYFVFNMAYFIFLELVPPFPPFYEDSFGKISIVGMILSLCFFSGIQSIVFCFVQLPKALEKNSIFLCFQLVNTLIIHFICIDGIIYRFRFEFTIIHIKEILIMTCIYYIGFLISYWKNIKVKR